MLKKILILAVITLAACSEKPVSWISTTNDERWTQQSNLALKDADSNAPFDLAVTGDTAQIIDGFGGCFNELGWDALQMLDKQTRDSILQELFVPEKGFNFTICRMPMGANDYSRRFYSYNETPGDVAMNTFSIAHDTIGLLPYIKEALKYNPKLHVWASPWCPPSWMKTNQHYACRMDQVNDLCCPEKEGREGVTQFRMEDDYLRAYSLYFQKFLEAYQKRATDIHIEPYRSKVRLRYRIVR
ncbi:MAG: beta-glycosidase, partial [Bacteroidetes bacterium]|nr:beta-glycosidase [Bacteroidota bacterium]